MKTHRTKSLGLITLVAFILVSCGPTERSSTDGTIAPSKGVGGVVRPCKKVGASVRLGGSNAVCALNGKTRMLFTVTETTKQRCNQVGRLRPAGLELSVCARSGSALRWMRVINPYVVDQSESTTEVADTPMADDEAKTEQTSPQANYAETSVPTTSDESAVSRPPLPTSPKNTEVSTADTTFSTPESAYDVLEVGTGRDFACALLRDRTVACWGSINKVGQLGSIDLQVESGALADARCFITLEDPDSGCTFATIVEDRQATNVVTKYITPAREQANQTLVRRRVPGVSNVKKIFVGEFGACALGMNGRVKCWGSYGIQKNFTVLSREASEFGTTIIRILPTEIGGLSNVIDLALGTPTCAVLSSGRVTCWEYKLNEISTLREIPGITNAVSITALEKRDVTPFCAVLRDSTARCWPDPKGLLTANVDGRSLVVAEEMFDGDEFEVVLRSKPILRCKLNRVTCEERVFTYGRRSIDCSATDAWIETEYLPAVEGGLESRLRANLTQEEYTEYLSLARRQARSGGLKYYDQVRLEELLTKATEQDPIDVSGLLSTMPDCRETIEPLRDIRQIIAPKSCICENQWEVCVVDTSNRLSCASSIIGRAANANLSLISASVGFKKLELGQHVRSKEGNVLACWLDDQSQLLCNGGLNSPAYPQPATLATSGFLGSNFFSDHVHVANLDEPVRSFSMYDASVCALTFSDVVYCWGKNGNVKTFGGVNQSRFIFD